MIRRLVLPVLVVAFVAVVLASRHELQHLGRTLALGRWEWVMAAALLQLAYYAVYAELFRGSLSAVGVGIPRRASFTALMGSLFVNVVLPSGGAAGMALFVDEARRRGQSAPRAAAGILLAMTMDFVALAFLLLGSLAYLSRRGGLRSSEVIGTGALVGLTGAMSALLLLGLWRPAWVRAVLGWVQSAAARVASWLKRPPPLGADWVESTTNEFVAVSEAVHARPSRLAALLGVALAMHALDVASLGTLFVAFRQAIRPGGLVAGYALGILAWILSPVPQGIGVVEGVMALVFASLGVPAGSATVIALAFRGLTFWLPMAAGFLLLRQLRSLRAETGAEAMVEAPREGERGGR